MSNKLSSKVFVSVVVLVLLLSLVGSVYAITGSIGNARMILRPDIGDTIERSILVKNVNDVALDIEVTASGDLIDDIEIIDSEFRLEAGEDKKAFFKIEVKRAGTSENKINVKFSPVDGGNGVGLSSTIIIIPEGEEDSSSGIGGFFEGLFGGEAGSSSSDDEASKSDEEVSVGQGKSDDVSEEASDVEDDDKKSGGMSLAVLVGTFTVILFVALLISLVVAGKHIKKRTVGKSEKKGTSSKDDVGPSDSGVDGKSDKSDSGPVTKSKKKSSDK